MTTKDTPEDVEEAIEHCEWMFEAYFERNPKAIQHLKVLIRAASEAEQRIAGERWLLADYKMCAEKWVKTLKEENERLRAELELVRAENARLDKLVYTVPPSKNPAIGRPTWKSYWEHAEEEIKRLRAGKVREVTYDKVLHYFGMICPPGYYPPQLKKLAEDFPNGLRIVGDGVDQKEPELLKNPSGWGHDQD